MQALRVGAHLLPLAFLLLIVVGVAHGAGGALDPRFGSQGIAISVIGARNAAVGGLVAQSDGKIIAAGSANDGSSNRFAVARYTREGSLDMGFGDGGSVTTSLSSARDDAAGDIAQQADGMIVVAGVSFDGSGDRFALARYDPHGALDSSFGTGGKVTTDFGSDGAAASAIAVQPDRKIVAAGYSERGASYDFALARYNPDGSLDAGFGVQGTVTTDFGSANDFALAVAVQADRKIVVAGFSEHNDTAMFALARYKPDGSLDPTFGTGGKVTGSGFGNGRAYGVALQSDRKIVVAGSRSTRGGDRLALARYQPDGSLDRTFGSGGRVTTAFSSGGAVAHAVAVTRSGKIVVGGFTWNKTYADFALARYRPNGSLDPTFGVGGRVTTDIDADDDFANAVVVQPDGKIVLGGVSFDGARGRFALARYLGAETRIPCHVPNLKGKPLVTARQAARKAHCAVGRIGRTFSRTVRAGRVISQHPAAGARRPAGAKVSVIVSRGPKRAAHSN
jgi:uncharacterized delta-60 repeat protein